ncbi:hypothetical protein NQ318_004138 [Aromia moschata]|uniref:Flavin-containing monooxygenase n=1 Tax=Aromia moschata TaxID=1265417 RepID=A0AAV8YMK7_9CUCU|nr:hypothetical protein NQ318_004138 [Aromia moschata]
MKIAIIGAGAAGLAALRHSLDDGHECVAFEKTGAIGGTWNYVDEVGTDEYGLPIHSSMYKGLRTNLPKELMQYEDFPYTEPERSYLFQPEVLNYMNKYVDFFKLLPHIKLFTHVQLVEPLPEEKWKITIKDLKTGKTEENVYDAVFVCVGNYSVPKVPEMDGISKFEGKVIHSHKYRTSNPFTARRVLVVGAGPSGVDISSIISDVADKVFVSIRSSTFLNLSEKITVKQEIEYFEKHSVVFKDGTKEDIDDVIFCTGYIYSYPFLSPTCAIKVENNWVKHLYKQIVNIQHPTMGFIGIPFRIIPFPVVGIQVRFFLAFLKGNVKISKDEMMRELNEYMLKKEEETGAARQAHFLGLEQGWYMDDLADTANIKRVPPVIYKLYHHIHTFAKGKRHLSYKILNDNEFIEIS